MRRVDTVRWTELAVLSAILALASYLRFYHLQTRGLILWDEGKFALEGIRMQQIWAALGGHNIAFAAGKSVGSAKPGHALLIGLGYVTFGVHDYVPLFLNASASIVEVALIFLIGRHLFDWLTGLVGALFMAVSPYDIMYARSALSENDATAFLLVGFLVWLCGLQSPDRFRGVSGINSRLVVAGLLYALAFTVNYRLILYIATLVFFDVAHCSLRDKGMVPGRILSWGVGLLFPPVAWQVAGAVFAQHGFVLFVGDLPRQPTSYLAEVVYQLHEGKQAVLHFEPGLYIQWLLAREGWLMLALLLGGFLIAFSRRSSAWLAVALPVGIPYIIYVFAPFVVPRNLVAGLPFAFVLAAAALVSLLRELPGRRIELIIAVVALVPTVMNSTRAWRLTDVRSGFAAATSLLEKKGEHQALTSTEIMVFYLRGKGRYCSAPALPLTIAGLEAYVREGYRYAVLENHNRSRVSDFIRSRASRIARIPALGTSSLGEDPISSENSSAPSSSTPTEWVDVYGLRGLRFPLANEQPAQPCRRDDVV